MLGTAENSQGGFWDLPGLDFFHPLNISVGFPWNLKISEGLLKLWIPQGHPHEQRDQPGLGFLDPLGEVSP